MKRKIASWRAGEMLRAFATGRICESELHSKIQYHNYNWMCSSKSRFLYGIMNPYCFPASIAWINSIILHTCVKWFSFFNMVKFIFVSRQHWSSKRQNNVVWTTKGSLSLDLCVFWRCNPPPKDAILEWVYACKKWRSTWIRVGSRLKPDPLKSVGL